MIGNFEKAKFYFFYLFLLFMLALLLFSASKLTKLVASFSSLGGQFHLDL